MGIMNPQELELHYPWNDTLPDPDMGMQVAPGVFWVRMSLPFVLNHINLWLLRDEIDGVQGWTVVDCCIDHPASRAQWEGIFLQRMQALPILRVIVTHMHPDHVGLAHWLCDKFQAPLWISATDFYTARSALQGKHHFGGDRAAAFFALNGLTDPQALAAVRDRQGYFKQLVPDLPPAYRRLMDGQRLMIGGREWHTIAGYGHAPEHMALHCPSLNLLISGDMVLPRISTNVSVFETEPDANSLTLFLQSLDRFLNLPSDTLVLPSHGKPFTGLLTRIRQLHEHHEERLREVIHACQEKPCCAVDIMPVLFKRALDLHQTTFALGESLAHLHALWHQGQLRRHKDAKGVLRFSPSEAPAHP
jgi:glyoxylase-like metal-dependent hydrolase (beta-lactamase superfamily II)